MAFRRDLSPRPRRQVQFSTAARRVSHCRQAAYHFWLADSPRRPSGQECGATQCRRDAGSIGLRSSDPERPARSGRGRLRDRRSSRCSARSAPLFRARHPDDLAKRAVELALGAVGLVRAGVYFYDDRLDLMVGTWGTDLRQQRDRRALRDVSPRRARALGVRAGDVRRGAVDRRRGLPDHRERGDEHARGRAGLDGVHADLLGGQAAGRALQRRRADARARRSAQADERRAAVRAGGDAAGRDAALAQPELRLGTGGASPGGDQGGPHAGGRSVAVGRRSRRAASR